MQLIFFRRGKDKAELFLKRKQSVHYKTNEPYHLTYSKSSALLRGENAIKLWAMPCRASQDGQVVVESSDKIWSTGEVNGKLLQYSCLENHMMSMKRQKDGMLKHELLTLVGAWYAAEKITPERKKRWSLPASSLGRIQGVPSGWTASAREREDTWDQPW